MKSERSFFELVYEITSQIPYGRVTTYGAIAKCISTGSAARMVGWALNNSHHQSDFIPAHRVVNRSGILTGKHHFGNTNTMKQLLQNEGIHIEDDRIINFEKHFWDPLKEIP